jgi:C1A family cysteine protease
LVLFTTRSQSAGFELCATLSVNLHILSLQTQKNSQLRKFKLVIALIFLNGWVFSQGSLKVAPINPDFITFLKEYKTGAEMFAAPSPHRLGFKEYFSQKQFLAPKSYPVVYDMRTAGPGGTSLMTPAKHQLGCGACWAFSTISSIESVWKKKELGDYDLSENNMKNCHGFDYEPCQWGHHFMTTAYLVRGSGPINEVDDPYDPINGPCAEGLLPEFYIPAARYLPEDHDAFKETILTRGAVYNTFKSVSASYQWINGHYTYCYQGGSTTSHAVAIAGWNDTITTSCGKGAWICKNSYGEGFGEDGYFYISYQDTLVLKYNAIYPDKEDFDPDLKIYQYDTIGGWPFVGYLDSVAYGLIKYTAESDMFLSRIGTYTVSYGTTLTIEIFENFDGVNLSGPMIGSFDHYCDFPGYWTIDIPVKLKLNQGQDFYIKIKYNSPGEEFPIAAEGIEVGYAIPDIETGKCWSKQEGGAWDAWGTGTDLMMDLCIKAYAHDVTKISVRVFLEGPFNGTGMNTNLVNSDEFPLSQPYADAPWNYEGTESVTGIPASAVDWVLVELRDTTGIAGEATSSAVVAKRAGFLLNDGTIVDLDGVSDLEFKMSVHNNLYVVIYHRNHLPVMSASNLQKIGGVYHYDFSDDISNAYGNSPAQKELMPGIYGMIAGDAEANGTIDDSDILNTWKNQAGEKGYKQADFNLNKEVSNADKNNYWLLNEGAEKQVPD